MRRIVMTQPSRGVPGGTFLAENENRRTVGEASCGWLQEIAKELRPDAGLGAFDTPHLAYRDGGSAVECTSDRATGKRMDLKQ